jgi:hypothetical protein
MGVRRHARKEKATPRVKKKRLGVERAQRIHFRGDWSLDAMRRNSSLLFCNFLLTSHCATSRLGFRVTQLPYFALADDVHRGRYSL